MINFNKTALVLIDLQEGILKMDYAPHTAENVVQNANKLIDVFRKNNGFIAFVRVNFYDGKDVLQPNAMISLPPKEGDDYSRFHHLLDKRDDDFVIDKRHFSAFVGTDLDLQLRRRGIDTIVQCIPINGTNNNYKRLSKYIELNIHLPPSIMLKGVSLFYKVLIRRVV